MNQERIGIIAGAGQFPALVADAARQAGCFVAICGFYGHTDTALEHKADTWALLHLGQLSKLIAYFTTHGVSQICFAGAISKPRALDMRPDMRAAKVLFKLRATGDDALLRAVLAELEMEGLNIMQAAELVPALRAPQGVLTRKAPSDAVWRDITYGWPIARQIGSLDIGQCMVVKQGMVVAVEGLEGTDAMLQRAGELAGPGCVALKIVKPGQDRRIDLPALGLATIRILERNRYACLCYEAGDTLFFDREQSISLADRSGIALVGVGADGPLVNL